MTAKYFDNRNWENTRFRRIERRFVRILLAGFGLVLVAMVASGIIGLDATGRIDRETSALSERYLRETNLIEQLARQQANLGVLLYSLADEHTQPGLVRLGNEFQIEREKTRRVVDEALAGNWSTAEITAWRAVQSAAEPLFDEVNTLVMKRRNNSADLSRLYHAFTTSTASLMEETYKDVVQSRAAQLTLDAGLVQTARNLFLVALALAAVCAAVSVAGSIASFRRLEDHAETLAKLSLHTLAEQEESARRFSQEMHDEFGQALNAIGSTLSVVQASDPDSRERLRDAVELVKEAQTMARELSQLLRPRILDDFGLDAGLRELARSFSQRTGIAVDYRSQVRERLAPLVETHLFRIAQESLTNTSRHTLASSVEMILERSGGDIHLKITDNGGGFAPDSRSHSTLGLIGMKERAHAVGGRVTVFSTPGAGVTIDALVPLQTPPAAPLARLHPAGESL